MAASHRIPSERDLELLSAYLDGQLSQRERQALEKRLGEEAPLRTALEDLRETVRLVRHLPPLKAPHHFTLDPAVYGQKTRWWKRLLASNTLLQVSGALGAAASIGLILIAVLLSSQAAAPQKHEAASIAQPTSVGYARTPAPPTLTAEPASSIQAGVNQPQALEEGIYQTQGVSGTLIPTATGMRSEQTEANEAAGAAPLIALTAAPTSSGIVADAAQMAASTPAALYAGQEGAGGSAYPPAEASSALEPGAAPPAPAASGETNNFAPAQNLAPPPTPTAEYYFEAPPSALPSPTTTEIVLQAVGAAGGAEELPTENEQLSQPAGNLTTVEILEPETIQEKNQPTASPAASPTLEPNTPVEVAQGPVDYGLMLEQQAETAPAEQEESHHPWWLAGIGIALFTLSAVLFVIGWTRARRP